MRTTILLLFSLVLGFSAAQAASGVTYHGRILRSDGSAVEGQFVGFKIHVLAGDAAACEMYQETHTKDMRNSNGAFSVVIGDGSVVGTYNVTGLSFFDEIFRNDLTFNFVAPAGCASTPYSPTARDNRKLYVQFRESPTDAWEDIPTMTISHVPFAYQSLYSEQVGLHTENSLLRVENAGVPAAAGALTSANYTELMAVLGGTTTQYIKAVAGTGGEVGVVTAGGTATVSLATSGVTAGTYGSATQVPVFAVDSKGRITSVTNTAITAGGGTITDLTGDVTATGSGSVAATIANSAVTYAKMQNVSATNRLMGRATAGAGVMEEITLGTGLSFTGTTLNASGLSAITNTASLANTKIWIGDGTGKAQEFALSGDATMTAGGLVTVDATNANTASKIMKRDASGNFVAGTGTFNTSVKVTDGAVGGQVTIAAPVAFTSYNLTLPVDDGTANQVLKTDGSGVLSWTTVGTGNGDALTTNPLSQFAATTSAQLAGVLSDETGSGAAVFGTSPTFTTGITSPMIIGGTGVASTLTYKTTTGVGAAGADHIFQVGNNGATEAMRITNAGRVGIGTNNPGFPLDVQSSGTTQLKLMNLSTGNTSMAMDSAAASKSVEIDFYDAGVSKWNFGKDTSNRFNLYDVVATRNVFSANPSGDFLIQQSGGNVNIGSALAANGKLDVRGTIVMSGTTSGYSGFQVPAVAGSTVYTLPSGAPASNMVLQSDNSGVLSWVSAGTGDFLKDGSIAMTGTLKMGGNTIYGNSTVSGNLTLESTSDATKGYVIMQPTSGNVGINTTTPVSPLHIATAPVASANVATLSIGSGGFGGGGAPAFVGDANGTIIGANAAAGYTGKLLDLQVAGVTKFKISSGGGITSAAGATFGGNVSTTGTFTAQNTIQSDVFSPTVYASSSAALAAPNGTSGIFDNNATTNGQIGGIIVRTRNSSAINQDAYFASVSTGGAGVYNPAIVIGAQTGATAYAERIRIDNTGNVGIGTSSPGALLDVKGHVANSGTAATVGSCGTGPSISGNDNRGSVTNGTGGVTSCVVTFNSAYTTAPICVVSWNGVASPTTGMSSVATTTTLTVYFSADSSSAVFNYHCIQ